MMLAHFLDHVQRVGAGVALMPMYTDGVPSNELTVS
jgi:hypothetical protein